MISTPETISIIIPTKGERPASLVSAIESVARQSTDLNLEIIIADDSVLGLDETAIYAAAGTHDLRIVPTSKTRGLTRQFGVDSATGDWVAFLDDDDIWDSKKLAYQLELAREIQLLGKEPVISCRIRHHFPENDRLVRGIPSRLLADEPVGEYLFVRRPANVRRPSIYTSTIFTSAHVAKNVPWITVPRHQDWDWLVRAQEIPGVKILHCPEELVTITVGSAGSISATNDWQSSMAWASQSLKHMDNPKIYVDFLAAQPLRYSLQSRQLSGIKAVLVEILSSRSFPSIQACMTGAAGIAPRRLMVQLMSLSTFWRKRQA